MKIEMHRILIRDLVAGYIDSDEEGVVGFSGRLNIRPIYQREFVYKDQQRAAVITSVRQGFPINVMYWSRNKGQEAYELMDGQQRTISICQFINGDFSISDPREPDTIKFFDNLAQDEKDQILDYPLHVYVCEGTDSEKLDWFRTINIAGVKLTTQELRNAVYAGPWLIDAKRRFSKTGGPAAAVGGDYMEGSAIRQELLETAIEWISEGKIEAYMAARQNDATANPLWLHFQAVIGWVKATFPVYRKEMKAVDWGTLYAAHQGDALDPAALEARIAAFMMDDDITRKTGIYPFVLDGQERHLNIRAFSQAVKRSTYEIQQGICPACTLAFDLEQMEGDHIDPWHSGGKTNAENCQMLCKPCNRRKSGK